MAIDSSPTAVRICAVIVNYQTADLVRDCLETLIPELDSQRDCVVVVDNASNDESTERLSATIAARGWQCVHLLAAPTNGGFAAGNNLGIRSRRAKAYLLLNSDTLVRKGAVHTLWQAMQRAGDVGIVSPRLEWENAEPQISCFRFHSPWSELIRASRTGVVRRLLERWEVPIPVQDTASEPEWTSFAAVLLRGEMIDRVGVLDDGYFMYYEDADYCRCARHDGWRIVHEPLARVVHLRGGSSPVKALEAARKLKPRYFYASRKRYFGKNCGRWGLSAANLLWSLGWAISRSREILEGGSRRTVPGELREIWRQ